MCARPCWFLSHVKSVWGVWGIIGTGSARACCILSFTQFHALLHAIFMQFWLFQPFLGQFQHVGYQNACTPAEKFNGNIFTHIHTLPHAILCNFYAVSHNFGFLSHFWANFNMLGIKKSVLELRNSLMVLAEAVLLQKGPEAPKKGQRLPKGAESPSAALCKGWTFWCNAPKYSSVKHIMIVKFIS